MISASEENKQEEHEEKKGNVIMKKVLVVDGMMCAHCQAHVKKALESVPGVVAADVDLNKKTATVDLSGEVADQALMDAVTEAGYTPSAAQWNEENERKGMPREHPRHTFIVNTKTMGYAHGSQKAKPMSRKDKPPTVQ